MFPPIATHDHVPTDPAATLAFVKRTRNELRTLRKIRLYKDRVQIIDVNKDSFEVRGIGYESAEVLPILEEVNAAYNPTTIHQPTDAEYKEFDTGRRYTWAHDRVM
jgi:hypothetical protein